ncbi:Voltage-dependent calcium channel beta subunit-associated regulatory protein [Bagarius yarrelli]|uniref:Voltage-dependent calcium channel beta subunit-associated regulatory protein n=1 Tax=Bagarius yarrelli TaxID=175774 RepID=A0A556UG67_BAGYA|nr:Voltage-dependent calcium channel beta subunit-associated regulatory protein [Bagarius yarrelli]
MSDEPPLLTTLTEHATDVPVASARPDNYVLLLVMLCVFAGGMLVLLSVLLIFCHRCCQSGRRYSRASDDLEKTNTTYVEESQPTQDIIVRMESTDTLSTSSCHGDENTERFQNSVYTGRRVSFNETVIFEQSKKNQERSKVRKWTRYTLTEGDFHHLKKARLTQLHVAPPAPNILTIMECDSPENSITLREKPQHKQSLSIFQLGESTLSESQLPWSSQNPSCALPGDTLNSVLDTSFISSTSEGSSEPPRSRTVEAMGNASLKMEGDPGCSQLAGASGASVRVGLGGGSTSGQSTMLHFLSRLRRHASLEGASPYFTIKKWKLDSSNRAASLDMRGSPRRRVFQRQRAASETLEQGEEDIQQLGAGGGNDFLLHVKPSQSQFDPPRRLSAGSLESSTTGCPPSPALINRLEVKTVFETGPRTEGNTTQTVCKVAESTSPHGKVEVERNGNTEDGILGATGGEEGVSIEGTSLFGLGNRQESLDQPNMYQDIWSLRASLEQYASSDLSSNDRDSTRSDADSVCSVGGLGASRTGILSYQSQDIDDEIDGDGELSYDDVVREVSSRRNGRDSVDSERGSDSEAGSRKLLQMDSGYASIEAPCKAPEELRLFGSPSGKTASERRRFFTNAGRKGTVCESFETRLFKEELEDEASESSINIESEGSHTTPQGQSRVSLRDTPEVQVETKPRPRFCRRDYSIDEKTEALFNEFLRHDPQFDQQGSPSLRHRHRSRIHLRKQWQRTKQYSDPGAARYSPSLERQRSYALRRGDSANYPLDTRYHSTLPRIASAADEEASEGATSEGTESPKAQGSGPAYEDNSNSSNNSSPVVKLQEDHPTLLFSTPSVKDSGTLEDCGSTGYPTETHRWSVTDPSSIKTSDSQWNTGILIPDNRYHLDKDPMDKGYMHSVVEPSPSDKLVSRLDERLYTDLRRTQGSQECLVTVTHISPDPSQD